MQNLLEEVKKLRATCSPKFQDQLVEAVEESKERLVRDYEDGNRAREELLKELVEEGERGKEKPHTER